MTVNTLTYSYDGDNHQLTASNNAGTYTTAYDALGQKTSEQEPFGAVLTMTYDAVGDRTQVQDSLGGITTDTYDALHRLATIQFGGSSQTPLRVDMTYTASNRLATMTRYSDLTGTTKVGLSAYNYDTGSHLTSLQQQNGSGSTLENYTYTYDHADRVTAETLNGSATSYAYDNTNQLTTVINGSGTTTYSYDAAGNRTMAGYQTGAGNELLNDGTWSYTYDANGSLVKKSQGASANTWTYGYANNGQMLWAKDSATDGGTVLTLVTCIYDALGNRAEEDVWTQSAGTTTVTRFAYDRQDVWADLNGSNALLTRYIRTNTVDQPFARISAGGTASWYLADRQGSVRNLTDNVGNLQDTVSYDAFGTVSSETAGSVGGRYKYDGREFDGAVALYYNRAREYDAAAGRWTTPDPTSFGAGDGNLYRYVGNAPTVRTDPSGLRGTVHFDVDDNTLYPPTGGIDHGGLFKIIANLRVEGAGHASGWVLQFVNMSWDIKTCDRNLNIKAHSPDEWWEIDAQKGRVRHEVADSKLASPLKFWEAWEVDDGKVNTSQGIASTDTFTGPTIGAPAGGIGLAPTYGNITIKTEARFYEAMPTAYVDGFAVPGQGTGWKYWNPKTTGWACASTVDNPGVSLAGPASERRLTAEWNDCDKTKGITGSAEYITGEPKASP